MSESVSDEAVAGMVRACRPGWTFDADTEARMETYRLVARLGAMACLPLWMEDATPEERDEREKQHREALSTDL
jgi:hypothetical protein